MQPNFQPAAALSEQPPTPIGPLFNKALAQLLPGDLSLETYNSQYLQRHSTSVQAILAAARVMYELHTPLGEIEATVFTALGAEAILTVKVPAPSVLRGTAFLHIALQAALSIVAFLTAIKSPRVEEFRTACDTKFELSTVFKSSTELAVLRKQALAGNDRQGEGDAV